MLRVIIKAAPNKEVINNILSLGEQLDFIYFNYEVNECPIYCAIINTHQALALVMLGRIDDPNSHCVFVRFQDTFFELSFSNNDGNLSIVMHNFFYIWEKRFPASRKFKADYTRYLRLILKITEQFQIIKILI